MNRLILIVDDEKNIRLTLMHALERLGTEIEIAGSGEEALEKLSARAYGLLLLDLRLPGMDGMEVLRRVREQYPSVRVIIITAHGTVGNAVVAMKLGAVDFIQKPFAPMEIRELVSRVIDREKLEEKDAKDYGTNMELARKEITDRRFDTARVYVQKAISIDSSHPEAFNMLGALLELKGDYLRAEKYYKAAVSLDPAYTAGRKNLERITNLTPDQKAQGGSDKSGLMGFLSNLFSGSSEKKE